VPDFSTFCTSFDLPPMTEKEIPNAVYYAAPQYIPLPITETALDWKIISGIPGAKESSLKVLLIAIPNQIIQGYQRVAKQAGLELYAVEAEALAITRALVKDIKKTICLIDIGVQSTTINIIDNGLLKKSYSFNFASGQLTQAIASTLGIDLARAEEIKSQEGLVSQDKKIAETLYLLIDPLIIEAKRILSDFEQKEGKTVGEIYLSGGTSNLPGLKEYFQEVFKVKMQIPNCFADFLYPPILEKTLEKMSPSFSVAVGVALEGLEGS
jgi:type IV pilus assembly protein PilM